MHAVACYRVVLAVALNNEATTGTLLLCRFMQVASVGTSLIG
jgi:hypothetical protein